MIDSKKILNIKFILVLLFLFLPWSISDYTDNLEPERVTSDLSFYEINTCKVSLIEFLIKNKNTIYQDHYHFTLNHYSSVGCFGKIAGVTQLNHEFYIAIGTNTIISTLVQGYFLAFAISFLKKNKKNNTFNNFKHQISLLISSLFSIIFFYSEVRFYEKQFYLLDFSKSFTYIFLFILVYSILKTTVEVINFRTDSLINFIPFLFLFIGAFTGLNLNIFILIFVYFGVYKILISRFSSLKIYGVLTITLLWTINAVGENYTFKPDKIRGFTSSAFNYRSIFIWAITFFIFAAGLHYFFKLSLKKINFEKFTNNMIFVSFSLIVLGIIGANFPLINFLNYFYFGQEKMGTTSNNPFQFDEWGEKIAWRGFTSSAESSGEFYGILIIFIYFLIFNGKKESVYYKFSFAFPFLGLYFSNNRTVFILLVLGLFSMLLKKKKLNRTITFLSICIFFYMLVVYIGSDKFTYVYSYQSVFIQSNNYSVANTSSTFLNLINSEYNKNLVFTIFFNIISFIGYILNRSELWGLFIARYNPNIFEYLFGSGPLQFGQLYSDIQVNQTSSFLMPHSSVLSYLLFFGLIGVTLLFIFLIFKIYKNKNIFNKEKYFLVFFIVFNLIKSDSLNYLSSFVLYSFIIFTVFNVRDLFSRRK